MQDPGGGAARDVQTAGLAGHAGRDKQGGRRIGMEKSLRWLAVIDAAASHIRERQVSRIRAGQ